MANIIEIVLKGTDKLTAPFQNAFRSAKDFEKAMFALGTVATGAITATAGALTTLTVAAINNADEMGKMAQRVGVPVEALSRLAHAAQLSNVSSQQLETALKGLGKAMQEAASNPASDAARAFDGMGVAIKDATGRLLSIEGVLLEISDRFRRYKDDVNQSNLALATFGKTGTDIIPFLNQGSEAIQQMGSEANAVTAQMARQADELKTNLDRLKTSLASIGSEIAAQVLPQLSALSKVLADAAAQRASLLDLSKAFEVLTKTLLSLRFGVEMLQAAWQAFIEIASIAEAPFHAETWAAAAKRIEEIRGQLLLTAAAYEQFWKAATPFPSGSPGPPSRGALMARAGMPEVQSEPAPSIKDDPEVVAANARYFALIEAAHAWAEQERGISQQLVADKVRMQQQGNQAIMSSTSQLFGTLGRLAATYGDKNFALVQAFQIGQAIMNTALGVTRAYAEYPWPYSTVVAGIVAALGAAEIAIIAGAKPGGQAHAGLDYVPREGTFLLDQGERVLSRRQNEDITEFLDEQRAGSMSVIINLDGEVLWRGIAQASRDGRLTIDARAVT